MLGILISTMASAAETAAFIPPRPLPPLAYELTGHAPPAQPPPLAYELTGRAGLIVGF